MVVLPEATPVTTPVDGSTVAIVGLVLLQVPPRLPLVANCAVELGHTVDEPLIVPALALGFTVSVNVTGEPVQPSNDGVTVTVVVNGLILLFIAVKAPIFPLPFKPNPIFTELAHV